MKLDRLLVDRRAAALVIAFVSALVYANSLGNRFAYDDQHIVQTNEAIQSLETLPGALLQPYWPGDYGKELGLYRPVTTAALGLQHIVSDGNPTVFHAFNVLAHVVASVLVYLLLLELMSMGAALAGALVFAVHPVHVEAVANVIGVAEIISSGALIAACLVHLRMSAARPWLGALLVGLLYAIGFGSKESAVTLPALIFLVDAARRRIGFGDLGAYLAQSWPVYLVMVGVAGGLLSLRFAVLGSIADPFAPLGADLLREIPRIWTVAEVWTHYVRLWAFPLDLSGDYSPNVIPVSTGWGATNSLGVLLALVFLGGSLVSWRRPEMGAGIDSGRAAAFGVVWFVIAISPVSNTVFLAGVLLAERTLYLPSVGLAAATGWLVVRLARDRPRGAWVALIVVLLGASVRTWTRTPSWYDNPTMLGQMIDDYPQSGRSQWILGDAFLRQGRVSEGLLAYRAAINSLGTHYQLVTEISKQLIDIEHYRAAEGLLQLAASQDPDFPLAHGLLALIRAEHGDAAGTEAHARTSLALWDEDPTRHHLLAWALAAQGDLDGATSSRERGDEQGTPLFWQSYVYTAYQRQAEADVSGAVAALDTAWTRVFTETGRDALDSIRVTDFGQRPRRAP